MTVEAKTLTAIRKKRGVGSLFLRICSFMFGLFLWLCALGFSATLIGIILAIPLFIGGASFILGSLGFNGVTCPNCFHKNYIYRKAVNLRCRLCKNTYIIEWKDVSKDEYKREQRAVWAQRKARFKKNEGDSVLELKDDT